MLERLVRGEAGADRGELEEYAARLAEVDGAEVEAVEDRGRRAALLDDARPPPFVLLHRRGPGDVVDGARSTDAAHRGLVVQVERAALLAPPLVAARAGDVEAEAVLQEAATRLGAVREGSNAVEALQREIGRNLRMLGDQGVVIRLDDGELEVEAFGIGEAQARRLEQDVDAVRLEALVPEIESFVGGDAPDDAVDHAGA